MVRRIARAAAAAAVVASAGAFVLPGGDAGSLLPGASGVTLDPVAAQLPGHPETVELSGSYRCTLSTGQTVVIGAEIHQGYRPDENAAAGPVRGSMACDGQSHRWTADVTAPHAFRTGSAWGRAVLRAETAGVSAEQAAAGPQTTLGEARDLTVTAPSPESGAESGAGSESGTGSAPEGASD